MIQIVTERDAIKSAPARWKKHYFIHEINQWAASMDVLKPPQEVYAKLCALNLDTCQPGDVNAIVGSNWTVYWCHSCSQPSPVSVLITNHCNDPDNPDEIYLCPTCARQIKALKLPETTQNKGKTLMEVLT